MLKTSNKSSALMRLLSVRGMQLCYKSNTKTMKKYIAKFAVLACVALFALNSQSQAACVHVKVAPVKASHCCAHKHRPVVKHQVVKRHHNHCCKLSHMDKRRRPMVPCRKEVCRHGR